MEPVIDKEKDNRSCVVNIPKPRVFAKCSEDLIKICSNRNPLTRQLDNRFRKPSETSLKKYFLRQSKPLRVKNGKIDDILLSFRQFASQENSIRNKQRVVVKAMEEYKIRSTDLRQRMYLESLPQDVTCLTDDVDKDFFNFINGRPIINRGGLFKSISNVYNYRLVKNIEVGYRMDTILNFDDMYEREQEKYNSSVVKCTNQAKCLEKFISEDYKKSMACLKRWDNVKKDLVSISMEMESLASEIFTIRSRLVCLDYMYNVQHKYGRFLYYLSPATWRAHNREFAQSTEIEAEGFDLKGSCDEDSFSAIFDNLKTQCARYSTNPAMYFKNPRDLKDVLETMEMQQQYQFSHVSHMAPLVTLLHMRKLNLREVIDLDSAAVKSSIEKFEVIIQFYTERCQQLESKFMKILHGLFYESVGTRDVLKLNLHLAFCFKHVLNEKPINMDIKALAKTLERIYLRYQMKLEDFQGNDVKKAIQECILEEKLKIKKAKEAARELRLFDRLKRELELSCAPLKKNADKIILPVTTEAPKGRLPKIKRKVKKATSKQKLEEKSLTECEIEYLHLFTDWNANEDPSKYLHNYKDLSQ